MKVLQINTSVNTGSTGRITEELGRLIVEKGHQSFIAYGRTANQSRSEVIKIGNKKDFLLHVIQSRLLDKHGFGSIRATKLFIDQIDSINPDLVHLQNIHGYYLNIRILFDYLKLKNLPVTWTFHDCWPFTGHCSYFDAVNCNKWQTECNTCPLHKAYPKSWMRDNSRNNYIHKKALFTNLNNLTIITPSNWLANHVKNSFLKDYPIKVIHNGVDLSVFKPIEKGPSIYKNKIPHGKFILGVASVWDKRKGLADFIQLRKLLPAEVNIVLVGLKPNQIADLPKGITGITRTENTHELAELYSNAEVLVNPTYVDNFPTTNIEALSCGTPVITYNTGGSPEAIDTNTGYVIGKGNLDELVNAIMKNINKGKSYYSKACIDRAENHFNYIDRFGEYVQLFENLIENSQLKTKKAINL